MTMPLRLAVPTRLLQLKPPGWGHRHSWLQGMPEGQAWDVNSEAVHLLCAWPCSLCPQMPFSWAPCTQRSAGW